MSRKPLPLTDTTPIATANEVAIADGHAALNAVAAIDTAQQEAVRQLAVKIGYQLPADCTDPDLIQRDIAANMRRSVEACLEVGRGLAVLKEACEHGQFLARLETLGIEKRIAQRFIQSALRFSNAASTPLLKAAASQTKLFEMLVLDDEQVEELEETGKTGGLALDDVATMSVKELRAAIRAEREARTAEKLKLEAVHKCDMLAKDRLMASVRERANEAEERLAKYETGVTPVDERVEAITNDITVHGKRADDALRMVELVIESIDAVVGQIFDTPADSRPDTAGAVLLAQRTRDQAYRLATTVGRIQAMVDTRLMPIIEGLEQYQPYTADADLQGNDA